MRRAGRRARLLPLVVALAAVLAGGSSLGLPGAPSPSAPAEVAVVPPVPETVAVAPAYTPPPGVTDLGPVGNDSSLTVDVGLASRDPSGLAAFVNATAVPGTPSFRHFLSASGADARFGAAPGAVASAESYFRGFGLSTSVHPDGLLLAVSGAGPAVARAFGTTLDVYRNATGATFVAHPTAASLPTVAPWTGVLGLSTAPSFEPNLGVSAVGPASEAAAGCGVYDGILTPCQVATAYDFAGLDAAGTNGSGERIAVVDPYAFDEDQSELASDFSQFTRAQGLPSGDLDFVYPVPTSANLNVSGTNSGWNYEDALDVEWARAAAPGATVEMVFSPNNGSGLYFAIDWVVAEGAANVLSMSWGEPEVGVFDAWSSPCPSACNASTDGSFAVLSPVLELAAVEGISTFSSSGDCGSADGTSGVAVSFPASDAFVTGVGATDLALSGTGAYASETAWSGNSSGARSPGCNDQGGSGGGYSTLPRPWWQTGAGTVPSKGRGVPDVAIVGGSASPVGIVIGGGEAGVYGTSVGTPIWAGIAATADQAAGGPLGSLNPELYRVLGGSNYTRDFHEITSGSNGYSAHAGWNPVTGIGTPVVGELLPDLVHVPIAASNLTTFVYASPRFGPAPLTVEFSVAVGGGSGTYALEGVAFGDGNSSSVVGGKATHTFVAAGVYSVQSYAVDGSGNVTASPPVVVVVGGGGPLSVVLSANTTAPAVGTNVTFTAAASGGKGPYFYNFSFGDGAYLENQSVASVGHVYVAQGSFCAEVVVRTASGPLDGGASARLPIAVGGAASPSCGNPAEPLTIVVGSSAEGVRDAPADFPSLFTVEGGATAPGGLKSEVGLTSNDPYVAACGCAIIRSQRTSPLETFQLEEWENDTVDGEATAITNVSVAPPLNATFTASTLLGPVPLSVTFSAAATGGYGASAADTRWSFGNGENGTGSTVPATYPVPGEYVAIASLSDEGYGNASEAFLIDAEPVGSSPVGVVGTVTPAVNVSSGTTVRWSATAVGPSSFPSGTVLAWEFGNGGSAFGPSANETFFAPADLPPDDDLAASVTVVSSHQVPLLRVPVVLPGFFAEETAGFVPAVDALNLSEELAPASGSVPLTSTGEAQASGPGGATVAWTFGDGIGAPGPDVLHVFARAGEFTVSVRAEDAFGDSADRLEAVVVNGTAAPGAPLPVALIVVAAGVGAGVVLAAVFVWGRRPRPRA